MVCVCGWFILWLSLWWCVCCIVVMVLLCPVPLCLLCVLFAGNLICMFKLFFSPVSFCLPLFTKY